MFENEYTSLWLILFVGIGTYSLRISGLMFSNYFTKHDTVKLFLNYLPSTLLLSLVAPSIIKEGLSGIIAILCIVLCMYKTKNILLCMIVGMGVIALSRNFL